jgi:hypothetical protein
MTDTDEAGKHVRWVIVRDGTEHGPAAKFLNEDQEWGGIETAMNFDSEAEAVNGAETLCPAFMPGHAESVSIE